MMSDSIACGVSACRPPIRGHCSPTLQLQKAPINAKHACQFYMFKQSSETFAYTHALYQHSQHGLCPQNWLCMHLFIALKPLL